MCRVIRSTRPNDPTSLPQALGSDLGSQVPEGGLSCPRKRPPRAGTREGALDGGQVKDWLS